MCVIWHRLSRFLSPPTTASFSPLLRGERPFNFGSTSCAKKLPGLDFFKQFYISEFVLFQLSFYFFWTLKLTCQFLPKIIMLFSFLEWYDNTIKNLSHLDLTKMFRRKRCKLRFSHSFASHTRKEFSEDNFYITLSNIIMSKSKFD